MACLWAIIYWIFWMKYNLSHVYVWQFKACVSLSLQEEWSTQLGSLGIHISRGAFFFPLSQYICTHAKQTDNSNISLPPYKCTVSPERNSDAWSWHCPARFRRHVFLRYVSWTCPPKGHQAAQSPDIKANYLTASHTGNLPKAYSV